VVVYEAEPGPDVWPAMLSMERDAAYQRGRQDQLAEHLERAQQRPTLTPLAWRYWNGSFGYLLTNDPEVAKQAGELGLEVTPLYAQADQPQRG